MLYLSIYIYLYVIYTYISTIVSTLSDLHSAPEPMHLGRAPIILPGDIPRDHPDVGKFIVGRLGDADLDPSAPPYDSVREYEDEGEGSLAGSLSSIQTSSSGGDAGMDYLITYGAPFRRLADLYLGEADEEEDDDAGE